MVNLLLDRYDIIQSLGSGGFGETFLARDRQMPSQRLVVVKKLKPANANQNTSTDFITQLFEKEAAVLEELGNGSTQIPKLYSYFSDNDEFYLVQEYIEGQSLSEVAPIGGEQAKTILSSLLNTLKFIHSKGIIHRDIKPENIILRDKDKLPVLIDFGAVKETMGVVQLGSGSMVSSVVIGTRGFMAPEQSAGRSVFSTDLYALGLTMIFAMTKKLPVEFATSQLTGEMDWQSDVPTVDPHLAQVLDKAIKMELSRRYPTAEAMYQDLESNHQSQPKTAPTLVIAPSASNSSGFPSTDVITSNRFYPQEPKAANQTVIALAIIIGAIAIAAGLGGGLLITQQMKETEARLAQVEKEKEEAELKRIEAEQKAIAETKRQQELAQDQLEQEREKLEEAAAQARRERQRLEESQKELNSIVNNTIREPDVQEFRQESRQESRSVNRSDAYQVINNLYQYLSNKNYSQARGLYSPTLQSSFNSNFFNQFDQVTVENLEVTNATADTISFIGSNTYYYPDGTSQRERRSYQVGLINGDPKIIDSKFLKVTKPRQ